MFRKGDRVRVKNTFSIDYMGKVGRIKRPGSLRGFWVVKFGGEDEVELPAYALTKALRYPTPHKGGQNAG